MKNKVSILSVVSLIVSLTSVILYFWPIMSKFNTVLYYGWLITSIISPFLPIISKAVRKITCKEGFHFEIIALVLGIYSFGGVVGYLLKKYTYVDFVCFIVFVLLFKLVDKIDVESIYNKYQKNNKSASAVERNSLYSEGRTEPVSDYFDSINDHENNTQNRPINTHKNKGSKKQKWFNGIAIILIVLLLGGNIFQLTANMQVNKENKATISKLESKTKKLQTQIDERNDRMNEYREEIEKLENKVDKYKNAYQFFNSYAVIVLDDGSNYYHKYKCSVFQNSDSSFWIYNIDAAKGSGYIACPACH